MCCRENDDVPHLLVHFCKELGEFVFVPQICIFGPYVEGVCCWGVLVLLAARSPIAELLVVASVAVLLVVVNLVVVKLVVEGSVVVVLPAVVLLAAASSVAELLAAGVVRC